MTDEIINLLRAQKLKDKIREIGHVFTDTELSSYTYVIPLDSRYLSVRDFANAWRDHEHPYAHSIIQTVTPNELSKEIRENYFAYMKYLEEHPEE